MASLDSQTCKVRAVINFPLGNTLEEAKDNLTRNGWDYALIVHDKDVKPNGEPKTPHIHVVYRARSRARLSTHLCRLADAFGVADNQVSVQVYEQWAYEVQYLIHANNKDKFQYAAKEIASNLSAADLEMALLEETAATLDIAQLIRIISEATSLTDVIVSVGLHNYAVYRNVVQDLIKEGMLGSAKQSATIKPTRKRSNVL